MSALISSNERYNLLTLPLTMRTSLLLATLGAALQVSAGVSGKQAPFRGDEAQTTKKRREFTTTVAS
jgi:hypothetical protein